MMKYRFVDKSQVATSLRRQDALQAALVAVEAEIIAAAVDGEGKQEAERVASERRALADAKIERESITDADVTANVREYLTTWCTGMEERHATLLTQVELGEENGDAGEVLEQQRTDAAHLGACLLAAYKVLDRTPEKPPVKGDGGTRSRQARRAKPTRPARAKKATKRR